MGIVPSLAAAVLKDFLKLRSCRRAGESAVVPDPVLILAGFIPPVAPKLVLFSHRLVLPGPVRARRPQDSRQDAGATRLTRSR